MAPITSSLFFDLYCGFIKNDESDFCPEFRELVKHNSNKTNLHYLVQTMEQEDVNYQMVLLLLDNISNLNEKFHGVSILRYIGNNPRLFDLIIGKMDDDNIVDYLAVYEWNITSITVHLMLLPKIKNYIFMSSFIWKYKPRIVIRLIELFDDDKLFANDNIGKPIFMETIKSINKYDTKIFKRVIDYVLSKQSCALQLDSLGNNIFHIVFKMDFKFDVFEFISANHGPMVKYLLGQRNFGNVLPDVSKKMLV
jgi:hypothetical protein